MANLSTLQVYPYRPRVLIAPLDWGLGHASRMVPIIHYFQSIGFEILIGITEKTGPLLCSYFPNLPTVDLTDHRIHYGRNRAETIFKLFATSFHFLTKIKSDRRKILEFQKMHRIDAIISDNRYGCFGNGIPNILVTHQLFLEPPVSWLSYRWGRYLLNKSLHRFFRPFDEIWVPDFPNSLLSGQLSRFSSTSHFALRKETIQKYPPPAKPPHEVRSPLGTEEISRRKALPKFPVRFIGPLSALADGWNANYSTTNQFGNPKEEVPQQIIGEKLKGNEEVGEEEIWQDIKNQQPLRIWKAVPQKVLILLSGPEPQRSLFEQKILKELEQSDWKFPIFLVQGTSGFQEQSAKNGIRIMKNQREGKLVVLPGLSGNALRHLVQESDWVIGRSGYSTAMDLFLLGKKAIMVPTPGQSEQEYLAKYFLENGIFFTTDQAIFQFTEAMAGAFAFYDLYPVEEKIKKVESWLQGTSPIESWISSFLEKNKGNWIKP